MEHGLENGRRCNQNHEEANWVLDSSLDYKGRVPLRASTGVWKASIFIIALEFSERLSTFGISSNLISYLTKVIRQDLKTAAKNVNYWIGVTTMMPLLGGFLADAYTGQFRMVFFASLIYLMGLCLLTVSQSAHVHRKVHEVLLFFGLYCLSVGTGGHNPCLQSLGADQFDSEHPDERKKKMSYFNWWNFALCFGLLLGMTVIVYIQDYVSWGVADLILTIIMAIAIVVFLIGRPYYRYRVAQGSPVTPLLQVLVAAFGKRNLACPFDPSRLYEIPESQKSRCRLLNHTNRFRFLDKAAIIEEDETSSSQKHNPNPNHNPWRLVTVTKVEETKLILNIIPIWLTSLTFGICVAQTSTFFVKQAAATNLNLSHNFKIPPASIFSLGAVGNIIFLTIYDRCLVPILRKANKNERGINILTRIGIGMALSIAAMAVAAIVERKRLKTAESDGLEGLTMSVFWLAPQILIMGLADAFALVGLQEYFYDQVPDSMRSLGIAFYLSVISAGNFLSSALITVVDHATAEWFGKSWFVKDINKSRLDSFYWVLTTISGLNLCVFVMIARRYSYKDVQRRMVVSVDEDQQQCRSTDKS